MSFTARIEGTLGVLTEAAREEQAWASLQVPLPSERPTPEQVAEATLAALGFTKEDLDAYERRYGLDLVESFADSFRTNGINPRAITVTDEHPRGVAAVSLPQEKVEFLQQFLAERRAGSTPPGAVTPGDAVAARHGLDAASLLRVSLAAAGNQPEPVTPTAERIKELLSYGVFDWTVSAGDERRIADLLKNDPNLAATVAELNRSGWLGPLFSRVDEPSTRRELVRLFGEGADPSTRALVEPHINSLGREWQVQYNLARLGVPGAGASFDRAPFADLVSGDPTAAFTGVGASGANPSSLSIPWGDQFNLLRDDPATVRRYTNPLGGLQTYLDGLTPDQRTRQAELLLRQPVSTTMPESYAGQLPSRADVIRAAAARYNLEPELVAAFILAEQRDQTRNEDAKDYTGATSLAGANTSIGLGQVVISTARRGDLFSDLVAPDTRSNLSHDDIADLLADDTTNIFAAAKYVRSVADAAAAAPPEVRARFQSYFPGVDFGRFSGHSSTWPLQNVQALGSEYTSAPWDNRPGGSPPFVDSPGWGRFVGEAYRDVQASRVFR
jgi:hypothetical protein